MMECECGAAYPALGYCEHCGRPRHQDCQCGRTIFWGMTCQCQEETMEKRYKVTVGCASASCLRWAEEGYVIKLEKPLTPFVGEKCWACDAPMAVRDIEEVVDPA